MTTQWSTQQLSGWGRHPVIDAKCTHPESRQEVLQAFLDRDGQTLLPHGLGRSYGDAALLKEGRIILTRRLDRMLNFDANAGLLTCEAGVTLRDLLETFVPRGFFPPVLPGTQNVSVGGAIGCNIHGKNHHIDGCFGDHVHAMELLLGTGDVITCTREATPDLFWATIGGMGLTGLILSATIQLVPIASEALITETTRIEHLDQFFEVSQAKKDFTHTMSWIDITQKGKKMGRGVFMCGRHAPEGTQFETGGVDRMAAALGKLISGKSFDSNLLLNRFTMGAFNEAYFRKEKKGCVRTTTHYQPFFFPLDAVADWNFIYGPRGFLQYQFVVPEHEAIREALTQVSKSGQLSFLSVLKEFGDSDQGGLSFPQNGYTLAMDFPHTGPPLLKLMDTLDALVVEAGGRVYMGKDARLPAHLLPHMYPDLDRWKEIRTAYDPAGVFASDLGKRLHLI